MQRQSLGSPSSKLQIHGGGKEQKLQLEEADEEKKAEKLLRPSSRTEKSIHLIPLLTLFCFLILYLVSHDPTQKDLVNIGGFKAISRPKETLEIGEFERFFEVEKSGVLAIRSHRSLQEVGKVPRKFRPSILHRKFGDF